jgi:hypothetical protein
MNSGEGQKKENYYVVRYAVRRDKVSTSVHLLEQIRGLGLSRERIWAGGER